MSGIPTSVAVPAGNTWTELVPPVGADSIVVIQQFHSDTNWDFRFDTALPAELAPAFTVRPTQAREWISWSVSAGHGVYVRHHGLDGDRWYTVSVEDA